MDYIGENIDEWLVFFMKSSEEKDSSCECNEFYRKFVDYTLTFLNLGNMSKGTEGSHRGR